MKYLCLGYYDEKKFDALPKAELDAIVSQCPAHDAALRESGRLIVTASLGSPRAGKARARGRARFRPPTAPSPRRRSRSDRSSSSRRRIWTKPSAWLRIIRRRIWASSWDGAWR